MPATESFEGHFDPGRTAQRPKILFLCTGNSCRSQMAEGWARQLIGSRYDVYSAGIRSHGLNRVAVQVMLDAGVDISAHRSKTLDRLGNLEFDYVVTVCDNAHESCPVFPGRAKVLHHSFDDPPRLAEFATSDDEAMGHYIRVRDEIRNFVGLLPDLLKKLA